MKNIRGYLKKQKRYFDDEGALNGYRWVGRGFITAGCLGYLCGHFINVGKSEDSIALLSIGRHAVISLFSVGFSMLMYRALKISNQMATME